MQHQIWGLSHLEFFYIFWACWSRIWNPFSCITSGFFYAALKIEKWRKWSFWRGYSHLKILKILKTKITIRSQITPAFQKSIRTKITIKFFFKTWMTEELSHRIRRLLCLFWNHGPARLPDLHLKTKRPKMSSGSKKPTQNECGPFWNPNFRKVRKTFLINFQ